MTDVSVGFRPPTDRHQHGVSIKISINLGKIFVPIFCLIKKNCCALNVGENLCIVTFFLFPDSGLNLLNSFDFFFYFEWRDTENIYLFQSDQSVNHSCLSVFTFLPKVRGKILAFVTSRGLENEQNRTEQKRRKKKKK